MRFPTRSSGIGNLLKMKSGEAVRGVFRGEPYLFRQHWKDGRSSICAGRDKCDLCKAGEKSSFRFRINFVILENGAFVAKVFEQGGVIYDALKAIHEGDYDLSTYQMKVTRHGQGTDTTYSIVPVPNGKLSKEHEKAVSELTLNALAGDSADDDEDA